MPIYQAFNSKINAWVKYEFGKKGSRILDVKERNPTTPFRKIKKKGKTN